VSARTAARLGIVLLLLAPLAVLAANPGWFGGDELRAVEAARHGPLPPPDYAAQGLFYRPLAWHWSAFLLAHIGAWPRLVHLADVLHHAGNGLLLVLVLARLCPSTSRAVAWFAFCVSPLAVGGAGWTAAVSDRLCLTGMLLAALLATWRKPASAWAVAGALVATVAALMSKETAVVLPVLLALLWWYRPEVVAPRVVLAALLCTSTYLIWRTTGHFAHQPPSDTSPAYAFATAPSHLAENAAIHAAAPFPAWVPNLELLRRQPQRHVLTITAGACLHVLLVLWLARAVSWRAATAYVFAYALAVAPVLPLGKVELHYPYVAATAFAALVTALVHAARTKPARVLLALLLALCWLRALAVSCKLWYHGRVESGVRATLAGHPPPAHGTAVVTGEPGAPLSILDRAFAGVPTVAGWRVLTGDADADGAGRAEPGANVWRLQLAADGWTVTEPGKR